MPNIKYRRGLANFPFHSLRMMFFALVTLTFDLDPLGQPRDYPYPFPAYMEHMRLKTTFFDLVTLTFDL